MNDATLFPIIIFLLTLYIGVWIAMGITAVWEWKWRRVAMPSPMECPSCGEIALCWCGRGKTRHGETFDEYKCEECHHYETS